MRRLLVICLALMVQVLGMPGLGLAEEFADPRFREVWARTDAAVAQGGISRAWLWGPAPFTTGLREPYRDAPGGQRLVQYFDKGRLELNRPDGPVTSGLLARDLITGLRAIGNSELEERRPASIGVVGDPDDTLGPTYATLRPLINRSPLEAGAPLVETIDRDGSVGADLVLARYGARADLLISETNHRLANIFRAYFDGQPLPNNEGLRSPAAPFSPWYTVTGLPITEAYWTRARVGGIDREVLVQAFERRVLTYTPANPPDSQVEMGNVGRHYRTWLTQSEATTPVIGLPCPQIIEPPLAAKGRSPYTLLGSGIHRVGDRRFVTGSLRNDGVTSSAIQVRVVGVDAAGRVVVRASSFTDRDYWPNGQVAAFRIDLVPGVEPVDWRIEIGEAIAKTTGGLAGGFAIEELHGVVDGLGIGRATGRLRYTGSEVFNDLAIVRVHALDACGSVVATGFTRVGGVRIEPNQLLDFSAILINAEGASRLRAIVEARTGTAFEVADDALRVYEGGIYPAPVMPIVIVGPTGRYERAYERPDGLVVRSVFQPVSG